MSPVSSNAKYPRHVNKGFVVVVVVVVDKNVRSGKLHDRNGPKSRNQIGRKLSVCISSLVSHES